MAGEKAKLLCGAHEMRTIYATAPKAGRAAGDVEQINDVTGFWLADTAGGQPGAFVVEASLAEIPAVGGATKAGTRIKFAKNVLVKQSKSKIEESDVGIVHHDAAPGAKRLIVVWGRI